MPDVQGSTDPSLGGYNSTVGVGGAVPAGVDPSSAGGASTATQNTTLGSILNSLTPFLNLGAGIGNILNPIAQAQANKWYQGLIVNILNNLTNNQGIGQQIYGNISPQILGSLGNITGNASQGLFGQGGLGSYLNQVNNQYGNISSLFPSTFNGPTTQGATQGIQGLSTSLNPSIQQAIQLLQGGTQGQQGLDLRGLSLLASGGWTPQLNSLAGFGTNALQGMYGQGGLTPQAAAGEGVALQGLLSGGNTPYTNAMQSWGTQQATQNPLLSMTQAASFARNQAATNAMQQAEAVRARALARGGGPGAIVASGTQNQAMADFADQISQQTSGAEQNALLQQQGLGLTEQENATRLSLGGAEIQNELLKTYGGILGGLSNTSANIFGTGGSLLQGANQGANANLNTGGNLIQTLLGSQNAGGNLVNNLTGTSGSLLNDLLNNEVQQGQLGNTRGYYTGTLQNQTLSDYLNGLNTYSNLLQSTLNPYTSLANEGLNYSAATFGPLGNLSRANPGITNPLFAVLSGLNTLPGLLSQLPGLTRTTGGNTGGGGTQPSGPGGSTTTANTPPFINPGSIAGRTVPYNPSPIGSPVGGFPPSGGDTPDTSGGMIPIGLPPPQNVPYDPSPIPGTLDDGNSAIYYDQNGVGYDQYGHVLGDSGYSNYTYTGPYGNESGTNYGFGGGGWGSGADWGGDVNV